MRSPSHIKQRAISPQYPASGKIPGNHARAPKRLFKAPPGGTKEYLRPPPGGTKPYLRPTLCSLAAPSVLRACPFKPRAPPAHTILSTYRRSPGYLRPHPGGTKGVFKARHPVPCQLPSSITSRALPPQNIASGKIPGNHAPATQRLLKAHYRYWGFPISNNSSPNTTCNIPAKSQGTQKIFQYSTIPIQSMFIKSCKILY